MRAVGRDLNGLRGRRELVIGGSLVALAARVLAAVVTAWIALLLAVAPAAGHSSLVGSDPPDAAVLAQPPTQLRLQFSEAVAPGLTTIDLVDGSGEAIGPVAVRADPDDAAALVIILPDLRRGAYRLSWKTVAADDLHATRGVLVFGVGAAAPGREASSTDATPPLEVGIRWLDLAALAGLLGALLVAVAVVHPLLRSTAGQADPAVREARRRAFLLATASGGLALLTGVGLVLAEAAAVARAPADIAAAAVAIVTGTPNGAHWLVREVAIATLVALAVDGARRRDGRPAFIATRIGLAVAALGGVVLAVAIAASSHLAADGTPGPVLVLAAHLLAAAAWTGGLAAAAASAVPLMRAPGPGPVVGRAILRRFGGLAVAAVAMLAVSGLLAAGSVVASPDALLFSAYGQALLLKGALFTVVGVLGLGHALGLHPWLRRSLSPFAGLRRPTSWPRIMPSLGAELAGGLAILAVAAFLGSSPPARGAPWQAPPVETQAAVDTPGAAAAAAPNASLVAMNADDLVMTVAIRPNQPGNNFVELAVLDSRRPAPAPIGTVAIRLTDPKGNVAPVPGLRDLGGGRYEGAIDNLAAAGAWAIEVVVTRPGMPDATSRTPWTVLPAAVRAPPATPRRPVVVSAEPLGPVTTGLAGALALAIVAVVAAIVARRRGRGRHRRGPPRIHSDITFRALAAAVPAESMEDAR